MTVPPQTFALLLVFASIGCAPAQSPAASAETVKYRGAIGCKSRQAMAEWMTLSPDGNSNPRSDRLVDDGRCLIMPNDWIIREQVEDPRGGQPAAMTVETPDGVVKLWGFPIDEE